jgi:hypothetical protein
MRRRPARPPLAGGPTEPFETAAAAWFWYMACLAASLDGARAVADRAATARPCEPADILATVEALARRRILRAGHVRALFRHGRRGAPPDPRCAEEAGDARLWDDALDRLATAWRAKGILAPADAPAGAAE